MAWLFGNDFDEMLNGKEIEESYATCRLQNWGLCSKLIRTVVALKALDKLNVSRRLTVSEDLLLFLPVCFLAATYKRINFIAYNYYNFDDQTSAIHKEFSVSSLLGMLEQNKYVVAKLTDFFTVHGYTAQFLFPIKKALVEFMSSKLWSIQGLAEDDEKDLVGKLASAHSCNKVLFPTDFCGLLAKFNMSFLKLLTCGCASLKNIIRKIN